MSGAVSLLPLSLTEVFTFPRPGQSEYLSRNLPGGPVIKTILLLKEMQVRSLVRN